MQVIALLLLVLAAWPSRGSRKTVRQLSASASICLLYVVLADAAGIAGLLALFLFVPVWLAMSIGRWLGKFDQPDAKRLNRG